MSVSFRRRALLPGPNVSASCSVSETWMRGLRARARASGALIRLPTHHNAWCGFHLWPAATRLGLRAPRPANRDIPAVQLDSAM
jgi:hypothetical protein